MIFAPFLSSLLIFDCDALIDSTDFKTKTATHDDNGLEERVTVLENKIENMVSKSIYLDANVLDLVLNVIIRLYLNGLFWQINFVKANNGEEHERRLTKEISEGKCCALEDRTRSAHYKRLPRVVRQHNMIAMKYISVANWSQRLTVFTIQHSVAPYNNGIGDVVCRAP